MATAVRPKVPAPPAWTQEAETGSPPLPQRKSFVDFCRCVKESNHPTTAYVASKRLDHTYGSGWVGGKRQVRKAAMDVTAGTVGGYLVPTAYTARLLKALAEESFLFPRATVLPMQASQLQAPIIDATSTASAGITPFYGGVQFKWGQSQAPAETEPKFRQLMLNAWDLLGYATVSNQFLYDLDDEGEQYLLRLFGRAAAHYAEYAFLQGTGTAQLMPLGILNAPGTLVVTRQSTTTVTIQDITKMTAALLPYSWRNAIWACNPTCLTPLQQLTQYFVNIELGDALYRNAAQAAGVLSTRPLFVTEKLPTVGTQGDLLLFDPSLYIIGLRMEAVIDVSEENLFQTYQTVFRVWLRLDGKPELNSTVTLQDGTTKAAAYVVLSTK